MDQIYILAGSAVAVGLMVLVAARARIARPVEPLDASAALALLALEFPDSRPADLWIAADGRGAVARDGESALVVYRLGDSWVARTLPWAAALAAPVQSGVVRFRIGDVNAPVARLAVSGVNPWPPQADPEAAAA